MFKLDCAPDFLLVASCRSPSGQQANKVFSNMPFASPALVNGRNSIGLVPLLRRRHEHVFDSEENASQQYESMLIFI
jgi:hypothetical protein